MRIVVRLVIDTLGFVRAILYPTGLWGTILFDQSSRYTLLLSDELEAEIRGVLGRPFLREKIGRLYDLRSSQILTVLERVEHIELVEIPSVPRDKIDDMVLATGAAGSAD